jgi:ribonuclease HI
MKKQKVANLIIYADGGSRGNPGQSGTGFVIYDDDKGELVRGGEYIGVTTNNQAEYLAVKHALQQAQQFEPDEIKFFLDSMLVVNQMKGLYKIKNRDLWPVHQQIKDLSDGVDVSFTHVKREKNEVADAIVNEVLDKHEVESVE